jgi:hypothetical protein
VRPRLSPLTRSCVNIAELCASASVRMHMRMSKDELVVKLLRALTESTGTDPEMRLASSCTVLLLTTDSVRNTGLSTPPSRAPCPRSFPGLSRPPLRLRCSVCRPSVTG